MRWSCIIAFWIFSIGLLSGQGGNPFDLQGRTANATPNSADQITSDASIILADSMKIDSLSVDTAMEVSVDNPFEVGLNRVKATNQSDIVAAPVALQKRTETNKSQTGSKVLWSAFSIFLALLLTAAGVILDRERLFVHFKSAIDTTSLKTAYRAIKSPFNLQFVLLYVAFFINVTLFLVIAAQRDFLPLDSTWYVLIFGLLVIYAVRHLIMLIIDYVYPLDNIVSVQNYSISIHNLVIAVIILPLIFGLQFGPATISSVFFYGGVVVIAGAYIVRQLKGLLLAMSIKGFNLIYFFIYLCAVEIAPFLLAFKALHLGV